MTKVSSVQTNSFFSFRRSHVERLILFQARKFQLWKLFYILLVAGGIYFIRRSYFYDDPFITYRYAQNLIQGNGFVYNPGERILSTTSPLFSIILALLSPFWTSLPQLAKAIGALSIALGALVLMDICSQIGSENLCNTALILYPSSALILGTLGSEIPLYILLSLLCFSLYQRQKYNSLALISSLLVLTRPDGAIVPLILLCDFLLKYRKLPNLKLLAIFLIVLLPWITFAWLYFGSPIPQTLVAKQHQGLMAISTRFAPGFLRIIRGPSLYGISPVHIGLAVIGLWRLCLYSRKCWVFLAWPFTYFLAYSLFGVTSYFWYYAALMPSLFFLIGGGIIVVTKFLAKIICKLNKRINPKNTTAPIAILMLLFLFTIPSWDYF